MSKQFPTAEEVLGFLSALEGKPSSRRELCKHFGIKGDDRRKLRRLLTALRMEGFIASGNRNDIRLAKKEPDKGKKKIAPKEELPILDVVVTGISSDGDPFCKPVDAALGGIYPSIILDAKANVTDGDIVTVRLTETIPGEFIGHIVESKKQKKSEEIPKLLGVYTASNRNFEPFTRSLSKVDFTVVQPPENIPNGAVVRVQLLQHKDGSTPVKILEVVAKSPIGLESVIAMQSHNIPNEFPEEVIAEAEKLPAELTKKEIAEREDIRKIPMVTIDGSDAKDFDDAVFAEPWDEKDGGYHLIVAIADVAHYIKEGGNIDKEALKRGNSTYLPDFVIPMLPERLCNDLCSLKPCVDRPVTAVHMWIDKSGNLKKYKFFRGIMHSHARLIYEELQAAKEGKHTEQTKKLWDSLQHLYGAYEVLAASRIKRGALDLDVPETQLMFDDEGKLTGVEKRERLDAHRLIEEMMVLANVASASVLSKGGYPCLYRIHPEPGREKLNNLKTVLKGYGIKASLPSFVRPKHIQQVVENIKGHEEAETLATVILRSQEQAKYDPENIGHFGLNLTHYAHFTSPIRRYSDLIVHRSLIKNLKLAGKGGIGTQAFQLEKIAEDICITERRSQLAEWEARDRIITRFYTDFVGKEFEAQVASVQTFGMYVSIENGIAEGLLPARTMKDDYYIHDAKNATMTGRKTKKVYKVGTTLTVKLLEADIISGRLTFGLADVEEVDREDRRPSRRASSKKTYKYATKHKKSRKFGKNGTKKPRRKR
jgi:ribonuclease R